MGQCQEFTQEACCVQILVRLLDLGDFRPLHESLRNEWKANFVLVGVCPEFLVIIEENQRFVSLRAHCSIGCEG